MTIRSPEIRLAATMMDEARIFYRLDASDRIFEVGGESWDQFARDNGGQSVVRGRVEGTSLSAHIVGVRTRTFVWTMLEAVRRLGRATTKPYRCDSPSQKRFMEMTIEPDGDGRLLVRHNLVRVEPLPVNLAFTTAPAGRAGRLLLRCSMCNRLRVKGDWHEPEEAMKSLGRPEPEGALTVAYAVCEPCRTRIQDRYSRTVLARAANGPDRDSDPFAVG